MAKALMILGTGSGAGKSLIAAALCRLYWERGLAVVPFKAQNMALNSFVTREGGEIGRAQALQAEAAGVEPHTDMNPVLLKASGEAGSQVIVQGRPVRHMQAKEYYRYRDEAWAAVRESYARLAKSADLVVMEGAGSPAEINLLDVDIVNLAAARMAKAPALLVGDIDRGGVFAALYGTVKVLGRAASPIKGFIINKFRGDADILTPGLDMIRQKTGRPVLGVLPYVNDIGLPEEDGLALVKGNRSGRHGALKVVVVRFPFLSNFTDFDPFLVEPDVELHYSANPTDIEHADLVILPGTKNTVKDLRFLREQGLDKSLARVFATGRRIMGICGGYQMLGRRLLDPHGVESGDREVAGLGLLDTETTFAPAKATYRVQAEVLEDGGLRGERLDGYEIHMGRSTGAIGLFRLTRTPGDSQPVLDGSRNRTCMGTYLHGIFENDRFRRHLLDEIRGERGLAPLEHLTGFRETTDRALGRLAATVAEHLDMGFVDRLLGLR